MSDLFRFNSQIAVQAQGQGVRFFLDVGSGPIGSYLISRDQIAAFIRWCRSHSSGKPAPHAFSQRLDGECGRSGQRRGVARRVSQSLGVSDMCIYHWRRAHALPSAAQAKQIAEHFGWNVEEALVDLAEEEAERRIKTRRRKEDRAKSEHAVL